MAASVDSALPLPKLAENGQTSVYAACGICLPFALIALTLRFVARRLTKAKLWYDDWFVVAAMVGDIGFFISTIILLKNGMGKHYQTITQDQYISFAKTYIPAACFYALGIGMTKMSLLAFYYRIFNSMKSIRIPIYSLSFVVIGWTISVVVVSIFSCTPVAFWWDRTIPDGHCVNNTAFLLGNSLPNICTDFLILGLPLPYIWNLNQSLGRKIAISGLFLLGGFICIITIVRLVIQLRTDFTSLDLTWSITHFVTWTNVEVSLAIVSACLPSLRPIVSYVKNGGHVLQANTANSPAYDANAYAARKTSGPVGSPNGYVEHIRLESSATSRNQSSTDEYLLIEEGKTVMAVGHGFQTRK